MRIRKLLALVLALLFAAAAFPAAISAEEMRDLVVGEPFFELFWEGYDEHDNVEIISGSLPPGVSLSREYDGINGDYDFVISGTPTKKGTYSFTLEIQPYGAMYSSVDFVFTVREAPKITGSLPEATVGKYYQEKIKTNYPDGMVEFTEIWNPGAGAVLQNLGLELTTEGIVRGTPKKAGTFTAYIYLITTDGYVDAYVTLKFTVKEAEPDVTPEPVPEYKAPGLSFGSDSFIDYVPGTEFDVILISDIAAGTTVGSAAGKLPEGTELYTDPATGSIGIRGTISSQTAGEDGVFDFALPVTSGELTWYACFRLRMKPVDELSGYPAGKPLTVGFGS